MEEAGLAISVFHIWLQMLPKMLQQCSPLLWTAFILCCVGYLSSAEADESFIDTIAKIRQAIGGPAAEISESNMGTVALIGLSNSGSFFCE